jgi:hypothetical protein
MVDPSLTPPESSGYLAAATESPTTRHSELCERSEMAEPPRNRGTFRARRRASLIRSRSAVRDRSHAFTMTRLASSRRTPKDSSARTRRPSRSSSTRTDRRLAHTRRLPTLPGTHALRSHARLVPRRMLSGGVRAVLRGGITAEIRRHARPERLLAHPGVREAEVEFPMSSAVVRGLPSPFDGGAVG